MAVQVEREYEARVAAKANAEKVNLVKENKVEEQKAYENVEPIKGSRNVDEYVGTSQVFEVTEEISPSGNDLGGQAGASAPEEQEAAVAEAKSTEEFNFECGGVDESAGDGRKTCVGGPDAVAAYNAGPQAMINAGGVPNYSETCQYVVNVAKNYQKLFQMMEKSKQCSTCDDRDAKNF